MYSLSAIFAVTLAILPYFFVKGVDNVNQIDQDVFIESWAENINLTAMTTNGSVQTFEGIVQTLQFISLSPVSNSTKNNGKLNIDVFVSEGNQVQVVRRVPKLPSIVNNSYPPTAGFDIVANSSNPSKPSNASNMFMNYTKSTIPSTNPVKTLNLSSSTNSSTYPSTNKTLPNFKTSNSIEPIALPPQEYNDTSLGNKIFQIPAKEMPMRTIFNITTTTIWPTTVETSKENKSTLNNSQAFPPALPYTKGSIPYPPFGMHPANPFSRNNKEGEVKHGPNNEYDLYPSYPESSLKQNQAWNNIVNQVAEELEYDEELENSMDSNGPFNNIMDQDTIPRDIYKDHFISPGKTFGNITFGKPVESSASFTLEGKQWIEGNSSNLTQIYILSSSLNESSPVLNVSVQTSSPNILPVSFNQTNTTVANVMQQLKNVVNNVSQIVLQAETNLLSDLSDQDNSNKNEGNMTQQLMDDMFEQNDQPMINNSGIFENKLTTPKVTPENITSNANNTLEMATTPPGSGSAAVNVVPSWTCLIIIAAAVTIYMQGPSSK